MTNHLTDLQKKLVALTRDLIMIPSDESRPDDIEHCFEFIINHLESLDTVAIKKHYHRGITSLVMLPKNIDKPKVLLCGHLDVITHSNSHCYRSHITDGKIIGPGSGDMKRPPGNSSESFHGISYET
ncbi:MAG: hypothetical protein NUV44_00490 [Candidatus Scalindua sp.]|nr:hypothetical protein [Candidatus Scalindua sp.]